MVSVYILGIPIGLFQSMFPIITKDVYNLTPEQNGYMMSYVGVVSMVSIINKLHVGNVVTLVFKHCSHQAP